MRGVFFLAWGILTSYGALFAQGDPVTTPSEPTAAVASALQVVLLQIDSYDDFREIRATLQRQSGVYGVHVRSETPRLVTLGVDYSGSPSQLTESLKGIFGSRYAISQKSLPTGVTEINILNKR